MSKIQLIANDDPKQTGHLFCNECATELMVVTDSWTVYLNPNYKPEWDLPWHEYHNIKFLYPDLIKTFMDKDFVYDCPYCSGGDILALSALDNSILDAALILRSLGPQPELYQCIRCDGEFVNLKCMAKVGHDYICNDCVLYA